jgi:hypothetical protein
MRSAHDCGRAFSRAHRPGSARRFQIHSTAGLAVLLAGGLALAGCSDAPPPPTAPAAARAASATADSLAVAYPLVAIQPQQTTLAIGDTAHLLAKLTAGSGSAWMGRQTSWKSSDTTVLSVKTSNWGVEGGDAATVTGRKAGRATITATTESNTAGTLTITVGGGAAAQTGAAPVGGWNMPAGMTVVCQTGAVTASSPGFSMPAGGSINFGGPVACAWNRNGGNGSIGLASSATNPDGSTNSDVQPSGYRVMFPAGQVNDPAWDMYVDHAAGTGTYYIGWKQRWEPRGSYQAVLSALNSGDSKAWAPKGPSGGDLTVMSFMGFGSTPVIGLNFQGVDGHNIPNVNQTSGSGTMPVTGAMTLPGLAAGHGGWDQEEVLIVSDGNMSTSTVSFFVNGAPAGTATGVTNANAWDATEQYLSRSVYSGTQAQTTYTDIDQVTIAVK